MALGNGLVLLIQSRLGSPPMAIGGFLAQLPKDYVADKSGPAYTYKFISDIPQKTLNGSTGFAFARVQIDCFAADAGSMIALSKAIGLALVDYSGTLPDSDATFVDSCNRSDMMDFDPVAPSNYRRMLEFEIYYTNYF